MRAPAISDAAVDRLANIIETVMDGAVVLVLVFAGAVGAGLATGVL